jgi:hypothetical protein
MATVELRGVEQQVWDRLPSVCMCCGEQATRSKYMKFAWVPRWVWGLFVLGMMPGLLVMFLQKRMSMHMPQCEKHKWPYFKSTMLGIVALLYLIVVPFVLIALGAALGRSGVAAVGPIMAVVFGAWFAGIFALLVTAIVIKRRNIRPMMITNDRLVLVGVSDEFARRLR